MAFLIDTHCHLAHKKLSRDVDGVLARAAQAHVAACICASGDLSEATAACELSRQYEGVFFTAGVHPHEAKDAAEGYLQQLRRLCAEATNVAVGEIGLDYHYNFSLPADQRRVFAEQLALAKELHKTIVVHMREAFEDTLAILTEQAVEGPGLVFHSFTDDEPSHLRRVMDLGAFVSFSGIVTFRKAGGLRDAAAAVGEDRLLIETDAPYLSPEPVRSMKINEPANVAHVALHLASVRGCPVERIAEITTANAVAVFNLPPVK